MHSQWDDEKVITDEHLLTANDALCIRWPRADGAPYVLTAAADNNETNRHFAGEVLKLTPSE